jgi:hypothetical protein
MLYKKIKTILITALITILIFTTCKYFMHNRTSTKAFIPKPVAEYKIDINEFKIKQVLTTNKLQTLEVDFEISFTDNRYDKSKLFDGLSKMLTSRNLLIENQYKAIYSYDLSKAQFINNSDGTYKIILNTNDVEVNLIQLNETKTKEQMSLIGRYYSSEDMTQILNKVNNLAKDKMNNQSNIDKCANIAISNLKNLLQNIGVDLNKIIIERNIN